MRFKLSFRAILHRAGCVPTHYRLSAEWHGGSRFVEKPNRIKGFEQF